MWSGEAKLFYSLAKKQQAGNCQGDMQSHKSVRILILTIYVACTHTINLERNPRFDIYQPLICNFPSHSSPTHSKDKEQRS